MELIKLLEQYSDYLRYAKLKSLYLTKLEAKKIEQVQGRIERLYYYLLPWKTRDVSFTDCINSRITKHSQLIDKLKTEYEQYLAQYSDEQRTKTIMILREIETKELSEIYGGSVLTIDFSPEN